MKNGSVCTPCVEYAVPDAIHDDIAPAQMFTRMIDVAHPYRKQIWLALGATGCDSSGNGVPGQGVNTAPAGTYSLTITATDSGVQHAITVTVINP